MSRFVENVFSQYDHIVHSGHPHSQGMPADPGRGVQNQAPAVEAPVQSEPPDDPPWHTRDDLADRMEAADKRLNEHMKNPQGATFQQDEDGMGKAYADTTAKGVYYDPASTTEYIKGSTTKQDWFDDATKIPFWGDTRDSERYQEAEKAYEDLGAQGHPIHRVVGHSLGGSVALQMQQDHGLTYSRTFGAPVLDVNPFGEAERYRHPLDPVSIFDRKAKWGSLKAYSHGYSGYGSFDR